MFPREWHTYRPAKDIGWNEYFVTFQGEYFNKLLNKIFQPNDPIIHIGINEQIVKHFLEMLDCAKAQSPGFQAVMAGIMMHMIGDIYSINKNYDCEPASLQKIQEACVLILENIYDKLTPEDIAESINMSYSNFRKSFKQYTESPSINTFYNKKLVISKITGQYGNVGPRHCNEVKFRVGQLLLVLFQRVKRYKPTFLPEKFESCRKKPQRLCIKRGHSVNKPFYFSSLTEYPELYHSLHL